MAWKDEDRIGKGFIIVLVLLAIWISAGLLVKLISKTEAKPKPPVEVIEIENNISETDTLLELKLDALMEELRNEDKVKAKLHKRYNPDVTVDLEADAELPTMGLTTEVSVKDIMSDSIREAKEYYKMK